MFHEMNFDVSWMDLSTPVRSTSVTWCLLRFFHMNIGIFYVEKLMSNIACTLF
jgi:hypothetical protein